MHGWWRHAEILPQVGLGRRLAVNLGKVIDERKVLTLLRSESRPRRYNRLSDWRQGSLIRELIEEMAESITHGIKDAPNPAVVAVVGLGGHTTEQIVDVVKRQIDSDLRICVRRSPESCFDLRLKHRSFDDQITPIRREPT